MLRHGQEQDVVRSPERLEAAGRYLVALGRQTEAPREREEDWATKPSVLCSYCDSRARCPAIYRRVGELDRILLAELEHLDRVVAGGMEWKQIGTETFYPEVARVVQAFVRWGRVPAERAVQELRAGIAEADVKKLREEVAPRIGRGDAIQLDVALAAAAQTRAPKWPKVEGRKVKG